jgi:putative endonuclease
MLQQRIYQHKMKLVAGFSEKYNLEKLVYFEQFENIEDAILREKRLKNWHRAWKERLINSMNPEWIDLYDSLF